MRIWTVHPKYLDPQGLVTLWREALLARAVLCGQTKGYRHHPQLHRFKDCAGPRSAINSYLASVFTEAKARGYAFDRSKIGPVRGTPKIFCTEGQLDYEWQHLLRKLSIRSPSLYEQWRRIARPEAHPLFRIRAGSIEPWERTTNIAKTE